MDWLAEDGEASWGESIDDFEALEWEAVDWEALVEPSRQRGVKDADLEVGEELRLSPMFPVVLGPHLDIPAAERMKILGSKQGQEASDSPTYLTVSSVAVIEACAAATFPLDARGLDRDNSTPGTGFAVSEKILCSAKHMIKDEMGNDLHRFRVALVTSFRPEMFSKSSTPRIFLTWKKDLPDAEVQNYDPIRDVPHFVGVAESYLQHSDASFWDITSRDLFQDAVKPKRGSKFDRFWLPCSLKREVDNVESAPCAMLSFPCSSTIKNLLKHDSLRLLRQYSFLRLDEYRKEIQDKANEDKVDAIVVEQDDRYKRFRTELRKKTGIEILRTLRETFSTFNDGDMMLSVGRILKSNCSMVATSLSSLPGSSGAPIFLLKPGLELMFVAVHNGPPLKADNYNVATSTNNPTFALQYFSHVIQTLPRPGHPYWSGRQPQRRLAAFSQWLVQNLPNFRRVTALDDAQKAWISHAESTEQASRKLDFQGL